jgi:hypothetical protein
VIEFGLARTPPGRLDAGLLGKRSEGKRFVTKLPEDLSRDVITPPIGSVTEPPDIVPLERVLLTCLSGPVLAC